MTPRQETLLKELLEKYISQAGPVSSSLLAKRMRVSSATVRNELAELEAQGYVLSPHTSAGRVPTLKGYEFYVQHCLQPKVPTDAMVKRLEACLRADHLAKALAKELAEFSHVAVMVALDKDSFYYTGISELFAQPEFNDQRSVVIISRVLDALDEALQQLYAQASEATSVLIGGANPLAADCALFVNRCAVEKGQDGIMAMLGPLRTNYNMNAGALAFAKRLLDQHNA
ncbi:MAG: HTH domain-containing protein [Parcubacteria group bacterium]|nr:HTH domain-containing protein [Parcubacteria group bacterium]